MAEPYCKDVATSGPLPPGWMVRPKEIADNLGVCVGSVYRRVREGSLKATNFGGRALWVYKPALQEFLDNRKAA